MLRYSKTLSLLVGVSSIAIAASAYAQDSGAEADASVEIEELVVTAQKFTSTAQDTPIAMRVLTPEDLISSGITDVNGLQRLAPDLGITTDTVFTKIAIRGVSSVDISEASDPALTISVDGEYINRPVALNANFFDLERIEVLRGPQGTLYGRNATAGALNIIAAKPKLGDIGGFAVVGYGNYNAINAQGAINLPIGDNAALRLAVMHNSHDGYTDNSPAGDGDTGNVNAARIGFAFEPSERVRLYIAGEYVNVDQTAPSQFGFGVNAATPGLQQLPQPGPLWTNPLAYTIPSGVDLPASFDPDAFPLANLGFFTSEQFALRGQANFDLGFGTLTYTGGYRNVETSAEQPLNGFLPEIFTFHNDKLDSITQSHELRLSGGESGKFVWQAGAFYFKETQDVARGLFLPLAGLPPTPAGSFLNYFYRDVDSTSKALFAQATYWVVPDVLSLTGGIRYTDDAKSGHYTNFGFRFNSGPNPPPVTAPGSVILNPFAESDQVTWQLGVQYEPAEEHLHYAKVSTGYKAGGFDNVGAFEPEQLTAFEVGSKNRFLDNRLEVNGAAFYYDYSNQQVQVFVDPSVGSRTLNAGASTIWGVEADVVWLITEDDRLTLGVNYLNAELTEFAGVPAPTLANPPAGQPPITLDLAGNKPPQAPEWTLTAGYEHTFHIGESKLVASAYTRYKSEYFITAFNFVGDRQEGYTATDLSLEYVAPDDRFRVQGYVRNLEDTRVKGFGAFTGGGINVYNFIFGAPRTFGVQVSANF